MSRPAARVETKRRECARERFTSAPRSIGRIWASSLAVHLLDVLYRRGDQMLQHGQVHVFQPLDVEAGLPALVLAQLRQEGLMAADGSHEVERQVLLAGGEAGQEPIPLATALVDVVVVPEAD